MIPRLAWHGEALLENFACEIEGGMTTCLLGPSGVGKSTVLRVIAGLETPGDLQLSASDQQKLAGRIAWMGQSDLLLPWLTVIDNVLIGLRLRGQPIGARERDAARGLLARVGLADKERAVPATLSGGERQRVALARTLMEDRPVVLMDEPFSALDAITRWRLQDLAATLLAGRTVLMVTHDPREALRLGHHIMVMIGQPARLVPIAAPATPPPRPLDSPEQLALEGEIIRRLAA